MSRRLLVLLALVPAADACGSVVHSEVARRAVLTMDLPKEVEDIVAQHIEAVDAGAPFPDYLFACGDDSAHGKGEYAHWHKFHHFFVEHIQRNHPNWARGDTHGAKLVAFLLGASSHYIADVHWHGMGPSLTGFIQQAGLQDWGCGGDLCWDAHDGTDTGGEFIFAMQHSADNIDPLTWWVPVSDIVQVFHMADLHVKPEWFRECAVVMAGAVVGVKLAEPALWTTFANQSAFLQQNIEDFFIGGLDDSAAWSALVWGEVVDWIEGKGSATTLEKAVEVVRQVEQASHGSMKRRRQLLQAEAARRQLSDEVIVREVEGGAIRIELASKHRTSRTITGDALADIPPQVATVDEGRLDLHSPSPSDKFVSDAPRPQGHTGGLGIDIDVAFSITLLLLLCCCCPFALLTKRGRRRMPKYLLTFTGTAAVALVIRWFIMSSARIEIDRSVLTYTGSALAMCDLDQDGTLDVVIGSPGRRSKGQPLTGDVLVRFGHGRPEARLPGRSILSRFGANLVCADLDGDGLQELFIAAPSEGPWEVMPRPGEDWYFENQTYFGAVHAYQWNGTDLAPRWSWRSNSNLGVCGSTLAAADGRLFVGCPYDPGASTFVGAAEGRVVALDSSGTLIWQSPGRTLGERFGSALAVMPELGLLAVGAPGFRGAGLMTTGAVSLLDTTSGSEVLRHETSEAKLQFGRSLAAFRGTLWVGAPGANHGFFPNAGRVDQFAVSLAGQQPSLSLERTLEPSARSQHAEFGLTLAAIPSGGVLVGEPFAESETGRVHAFLADGQVGSWQGSLPTGRFGMALAVTDTEAVVGAPKESRSYRGNLVGSGRQGAVYRFNLVSSAKEMSGVEYV